MSKTLGPLGQVVFDADPLATTDAWESLDETERTAYEMMAAAVAGEVRKQCIAACEAQHANAFGMGGVASIQNCIAAIDRLK